MKYWQKIATMLALALSTLGAMPAHAGEDAALQAEKALAQESICTRCHDESEQKPILTIKKSRHGVKTDGRTPTCQSCHGASEAHVQNSTHASERPLVDAFSAREKATSKDIEACVGCHNSGKRSHWQGSLHERAGVLCTTCHEMHTHKDKVRDKLTQPEVCFACHKEQRALYTRPSRHPIKDGKMACSDCHNPHGTSGPTLLARDSVVATCYTCHMEKRGPFIRNHQPAQEDCTICHNPHGSTMPNLLKARPPFLCQQCHEPATHQGRIATLTGSNANPAQAANTLARGCLNCHTNTHGTNNPANINNERTMRR
ncbi:DmsE family decaheme c-type cytochrome [Noviherbaspirillum sp.]|jgi:DmsE family decaheme c-type cytochrome|uniref:DmsE family decaheme c-type cytochrome n=1 Tax=Noviherbaspirillum sp. TaxID=1926288 RepID=UPI0025F9CE29|nr:DmsE family decaheme c-type cytochrome [Noviherbaspirillum sp.]